MTGHKGCREHCVPGFPHDLCLWPGGSTYRFLGTWCYKILFVCKAMIDSFTGRYRSGANHVTFYECHNIKGNKNVKLIVRQKGQLEFHAKRSRWCEANWSTWMSFKKVMLNAINTIKVNKLTKHRVNIIQKAQVNCQTKCHDGCQTKRSKSNIISKGQVMSCKRSSEMLFQKVNLSVMQKCQADCHTKRSSWLTYRRVMLTIANNLISFK